MRSILTLLAISLPLLLAAGCHEEERRDERTVRVQTPHGEYRVDIEGDDWDDWD